MFRNVAKRHPCPDVLEFLKCELLYQGIWGKYRQIDAKDWRIFEVLITNEMRQSLAKDCRYVFDETTNRSVVSVTVVSVTVRSPSNSATVCEAHNSLAASGQRKRRSLAKTQQASVSAGISVQPISAAECQNLSDDQSVCYGNWFFIQIFYNKKY